MKGIYIYLYLLYIFIINTNKNNKLQKILLTILFTIYSYLLRPLINQGLFSYHSCLIG